MHLFQALELLLAFLQDLLRHLGVFEALAELRDFLAAFIQLPQFLLNGLQLLPEEIFALGLVHLPFRLGLNLLLHGEHFDFFGQNLADPPEPRDRVLHLQDLLRHFHF